jgi:hypothetical protein
MLRSGITRRTLAVNPLGSLRLSSPSSRLLASHAAPTPASAGHDFKADEHHDDHHHHEDEPTGYLWSRQVRDGTPFVPIF